ncbi:MAG: hypothetical protein KAV82_15295 [Phycisphaerae bacterium]|nr:hypothetical protein [Phycisphaerae bacterium]
MIRHKAMFVGRMLPIVCGLALGLGLTTAGCSALNPQAVEILFPSDIATELGAGTIQNASGHVVVFFINNTRFNGNLLNYLRSRSVDVDSDPNLRPRVRFFVEVVFDSETSSIFEFVDGSDLFEGVVIGLDADGNPTFDAVEPPPDLTENTLTNSVLQCDIGAVRPAVEFITTTDSPIHMFVPAFLKEITIATTDLGLIRRELKSTVQPGFVPLVMDSVNESGTVVRRRNFGTRDIPGFPYNMTCGSVVTFILSGELTLPFVIDEMDLNVPGYLDTDNPSKDAVPGRFKLEVSVR